MATLSLLVLLPAALPPAAATGTCTGAFGVFACAGDWGNYEPCTEPWTFSSENTGVFVTAGYASASAGGSHSCHNFCIPNFGCFQGESRGMHAITYVYVVGQVAVTWSEGSNCSTWVYWWGPAGYQGRNLGCPIGGSPPLPWGHVLP